jgi:hypothetical protein
MCISAWFGKDSNAYFTDRQLIRRAFPTPVEGENVYRRCTIPLFPNKDWIISAAQKKCLRNTFEKIRILHGGKRFITKRTANNRRIPQICETFPEAKFIHIIRDGRAVASSLLKVGWWMDHKVWWWHLKTPRQLEMEGRNPIEIAARNWVEEINEIQVGLNAVDPHQVFEVKYEYLLHNFENTFLRMISFMGLEEDKSWIDSIKTLRVGNRNIQWEKNFKKEEHRILYGIQSELLKKFNYI